MATTIARVRATLTDQATTARSQVRPRTRPPYTAAIEFCCAHPDFTPLHLRTCGCQSAVSIPKPSMNQLLPVMTELLTKAADVGGTVLREAAWDGLFLFPTLVIGPQKPGASATTVKAEVKTRLELWNKGHMDTLAARARSTICPPVIQKQSTTGSPSGSATDSQEPIITGGSTVRHPRSYRSDGGHH